MAQPPGCFNAGIQFTEQGETIAQKNANKISVVYNLERFAAGVTRRQLLREETTTTDLELKPVTDKPTTVTGN